MHGTWSTNVTTIFHEKCAANRRIKYNNHSYSHSICYVLQTNENEMAHSQQQRRRRRRLIKVPEEISNEIRSTDNNNNNDNKSRSFEMDIGYDTAEYGMT